MYKTQDDGIVLKIFPDYIEHIICSYEEVKESAVILVKDDSFAFRIILLAGSGCSATASVGRAASY